MCLLTVILVSRGLLRHRNSTFVGVAVMIALFPVPVRLSSRTKGYQRAKARKVMKFTARGLDEMRALAASQGPEVEAYVKHQRLEKIFICYDKTPWDETVEAVELFEKENPEEKGTYTLVSPEECAEVRTDRPP